MTFALTAYIEAAMELAQFDKLEDGTFAGEIPKLPGVIGFGKTLKQCEHELRSTLEDWILANAPEFTRSMQQADAEIAAGEPGRVLDDLLAEIDAERVNP